MIPSTSPPMRRVSTPRSFYGPRASQFRRTLASGRLPIPNCARCAELRSADRRSASQYLKPESMPVNGIMAENTIACGLGCASCDRDALGAARKKPCLSMADVERIAAELRNNGIRYLSYYKLGEPFSSPAILQEIRTLRRHNPILHIEVGTNGLLLEGPERQEAALLLDGIHFSIDGVTDRMVRKYQKGGSFAAAYRNMAELVASRDSKGLRRPRIEWKYVLFRWNDKERHVRMAVELAKQAKVDVISFWPARSPVYGISWRYHVRGYFGNIGRPSWKGREVVLRPAA